MEERVVLAPAGYEVDPERGSDQERPWRLIKGLNARGIRVVVVARSVVRADELGSGVTLRLLPGKFPSSPAGRLLDRARLYLHARNVALSEVRRGGVLAVHHYGPCSQWSPSFVPRLSVPLIYGPLPLDRNRMAQAEWLMWLAVPANSFAGASIGFGLDRSIRPLARLLFQRTIARVDAVTVEARANIPSQRPDAYVIPPGIDTDTFHPDEGTAVRGRILAVGPLLPRKGLDVLVRALALACPNAPELHVVLAGDGPERVRLQQLAAGLGVAERISFVGRVPRNHLPELYRSAVAACHPARSDTFPLAPIEAMACGIPVLVSDSGALPEMVNDPRLVHPTNDAATLAGQLAWIVRDERSRLDLGEAARRRATTVYSWDRMCELYLALYRGRFTQTAVKGATQTPRSLCDAERSRENSTGSTEEEASQ